MSDKELTAKHAGGRPRKYNSPEQMQKAIDEYFKNVCGYQAMVNDEGEQIQDNKGKLIYKYIPPTITGLALHLDFTSRADLINYQGYSDQYYYTIKRAKLKVEQAIEEGSITGELSSVPCIFNLKNNFNWKDKTEMDLNATIIKEDSFDVVEPDADTE